MEQNTQEVAVQTYLKGVEIPPKILKKLDKLPGGYDEFADFLTGKDSVEEYTEIIDGMGSSEPENSSEMKTANKYAKMAWRVHDFLEANNLVTAEQLEKIRDATNNLWSDYGKF